MRELIREQLSQVDRDGHLSELRRTGLFGGGGHGRTLREAYRETIVEGNEGVVV
jgi:hypothetical protein